MTDFCKDLNLLYVSFRPIKSPLAILLLLRWKSESLTTKYKILNFDLSHKKKKKSKEKECGYRIGFGDIKIQQTCIDECVNT